MGIDVLTDARIVELLTMPKKVTQAPRKIKIKAKHEECDFEVQGEDGTSFTVYTRQNIILADCFSCGLRWNMPSGEPVSLVRYNRSGHGHGNSIEGSRFMNKFHIHKATERYIVAGKNPDGFAEETIAYTTLGGAVKALAADCKITGLTLPSRQTSLLPDGGETGR